METKMGIGKVTYKNREAYYTGTLPYDDKDGSVVDVVVLRKEDWELFARGHLAHLFAHSAPMTQALIDRFPDPIEFIPKKPNPDGEPVHLWLDHIVYTNDPNKGMVFIYKSVDAALGSEEYEG